MNHFAIWHDKAGNCPEVKVPGVEFPDMKSFDGDPTRQEKNLIMPEPCQFTATGLPLCSVIRPTSTENAGAMAAVTGLTSSGLFLWDNPGTSSPSSPVSRERRTRRSAVGPEQSSRSELITRIGLRPLRVRLAAVSFFCEEGAITHQPITKAAGLAGRPTLPLGEKLLVAFFCFGAAMCLFTVLILAFPESVLTPLPAIEAGGVERFSKDGRIRIPAHVGGGSGVRIGCAWIGEEARRGDGGSRF